MIVNLSDAELASVGAKTKSEFSAKLSEFVTESNRIKSLMESNATNFEALEKRIAALEAVKPLTEASVSTLIKDGARASLTEWAASTEGKALIGAEASRITVAAIAAIGTTPAKPTPAATEAPDKKVKPFAEVVQDIMASGKTKSAAITAAIESHPKEYQEYLRTGGNL